MRYRRTSPLRCAIVLFAMTAPAAAQERLTLEDAQARALAASHRLAELRARAAAAQSVVDGRATADRPVVSALAGYQRTNHVTPFTVPGPTGAPRAIYPDIPDNYRTRLDLQWPIYSGGRSDALERAARAEASAVAAEVQAAQADLRLEVARSFWALVTARAAVEVLEQAVARAQAHVRDARERFTAGLVPPNDVASAEAQESRQRMLLIEAQNQRDLSGADLARLVSRDALAPPIEPAAVLDGTTPATGDVAALVEEARRGRDERRALEQRVAAAEAQQTAARAGLRPMLALAGGVDYARPNPRVFPRAEDWQHSWDAGVNVSWPLWDSGRTRAEIAQSTHLATAARERLAEFDTLVALEVRQRQLEIASTRAAIEAAAEGVRAAAEARRVVTERYAAGVATQTEVLDAEVALLQAELDRTRALAGLKLAQARLARAIGR